jgi:hypothetical protein
MALMAAVQRQDEGDLENSFHRFPKNNVPGTRTVRIA